MTPQQLSALLWAVETLAACRNTLLQGAPVPLREQWDWQIDAARAALQSQYPAKGIQPYN